MPILSFYFQTVLPQGYLLICLLIGFLAALFLYPKHLQWSKKLRIILFFLRFLSVTLLLILFLKPFFRYENKIYENPVLVIGIDDSRSICMAEDSIQLVRLKSSLDSLKDVLAISGMDVQVRQVGNYHNSPKISDINFDFPYSDLSEFFNKAGEEFENRNLSGILMVTDGIFNRGTSPDASLLNKPVYVIALGDTFQKKDIVLKNLIYNKSVYKGNKFPLIAEIASYNLSGKKVTVQIRNNNRLVASKEIPVSSPKELSRVEFILRGDSTGKEIFTVHVLPLEGELTTVNNMRNAYIEILDKKEKILIIAAVPHPDLQAIVQCLGHTETYEVELKTLTVSNAGIENENPQLVIFHQIPNIYQLGNELPARFISKDIPVFYVLGSITKAGELKSLNAGCILNAKKEMDEVSAIANPLFEKFILSDEQKNFFVKAPPLNVLYGEYEVSPGADFVLYQKVGSVSTQNPLLILYEKGTSKSAILFGEGIWKWRLYESSLTMKEEPTGELLQSVTQYLITRRNLNKFRVYPLENEYYENERIIFSAETYNDVHEKIFNKEIFLEIRRKPDSLSGKEPEVMKFSFLNSHTYQGLDVGNLRTGLYTYSATTFLNGKQEMIKGIFTVKKIQLEETNLKADHSLLNRMATESGGGLFYKHQLNEIKKLFLTKPNAKKLLQTREDNLEWIHLKWLFLMLLLLVTAEWGLRKYFGQY